MPADQRLKPYVAGLLVDWLETAGTSTRHRAVVGSLAFVDISGFTRLTERLASTGKAGAEELSDVLDATFADLLAVAYSYGALLVKWGGDAVLLLFEGPDHACLAARAAYEMRARMRQIGRLRTSVGNVTLRMSVGVNSGTFDFFVGGDGHHELIVGGPAASHTAVLEGVAEAGEIVVGADTMEMLPASCVGAAKGDGWLLRRAPAVDPRCRCWPGRGEQVAYDACLDPALAAHLAAGQPDSEHRQIAVAFIEVSAVDGLLERQGPGLVASELHRLLSLVQDACTRHHVTFWETDISKDGFKILLVAGAPTTSGHDEEGLLRACRTILDGHNGPLLLRIGANCGRVFVGDFGPDFRRSFSVKGDAVNLAARVMAKAQHGRLLATTTILDRSRTTFDVEPLEPFMVKGKTRPVHAAVVGSVATAPRDDDRVPLAGRATEVETLSAAMTDARRGRGRSLAVSGAAGLGKSRLVDEVAGGHAASGLRIARAFCDDYESSTPYFPLRTLLRDVLGIESDADDAALVELLRARVTQKRPELAEWLPLLALPFGVELAATGTTAAVDPQFRPQQVARLVVDLLDECVRGPAMFVVEDAHFADDVTNVVLGRLAGGCRDRPWLLLTVGRTPAEYDVDEQISLEPLPDDDVAALARSAAGDRLLTPRTLAAIVGRAGGNPLFTLELTRKAALSDDLDVLDDLPDSLEELVGAEIDRLSPRARAVLRTAAVLGTSVDRDLLITVLGDDAEVDGGSDLARFLAPAGNGGWRFRSPVVRDAAYEGLPFRRRIELHGAIADAIETRSGDRRDDQAAALSLHALVARRYRAAWGYAMVAARRAADAYANADALVFVRRGQQAMRHLTDIPALDVAQLWVLAGELHSRLAELDPATAAYREARRRAPQEAVELRAHAALCAGLAAARRGAATRALRWLAVADREAATRHELRARVAVERAHLRYTEGRLPAARRLCAQAIDLATLAGADDTLGRGLLLLDWIDIAAGQPGDEHRVRQALALFEGCGSLHRQGAVWNHLGLRSFYAGAWDAAVTDYEHARDIFTRCGDEWSASIAAANVGEILVEQGRLAAAEPLVVAALQVWRASDTPSFVGFGAAILGRLHARLGRYAQATAELSEAVESYRTSDEPLELLDAQLRVVETLLLQGSAAAASRLLDDAETRLVAALRAAGLTGAPAGPATLLPAAAPQLATVLRLRGCALALSGDGAAAEAALRASLAAATARGADHDRAQALDALAWLIDPLGAQDEAVRTELHARLGIVWTPMLPRRASELPRQRGPVTRTKRPSGRPRSA